MKVCGIDPGYSAAAPGGVAVITRTLFGLEYLVTPMPLMAVPGTNNQHTRHLRQCDLYALTTFLRDQSPDIVVIEMQGTRPGQHAGRGFKAAVHYGTLIGVCCALDLPYELVQSNIWKADLKLSHTSKPGCIARATQLMPAAAKWWPRRKDHGAAEAALIAWWRLHHVNTPAGTAARQ